MTIRIVRMTFIPEKTEAFLEHFNIYRTKIRHFPGCRHLELWQDEDQKNVYYTYSFWEDREALEAYRKSDLFQSVWSETKILFSDKPVAFSVKREVIV